MTHGAIRVALFGKIWTEQVAQATLFGEGTIVLPITDVSIIHVPNEKSPVGSLYRIWLRKHILDLMTSVAGDQEKLASIISKSFHSSNVRVKTQLTDYPIEVESDGTVDGKERELLENFPVIEVHLLRDPDDEMVVKGMLETFNLLNIPAVRVGF